MSDEIDRDFGFSGYDDLWGYQEDMLAFLQEYDQTGSIDFLLMAWWISPDDCGVRERLAARVEEIYGNFEHAKQRTPAMRRWGKALEMRRLISQEKLTVESAAEELAEPGFAEDALIKAYYKLRRHIEVLDKIRP